MAQLQDTDDLSAATNHAAKTSLYEQATNPDSSCNHTHPPPFSMSSIPSPSSLFRRYCFLSVLKKCVKNASTKLKVPGLGVSWLRPSVVWTKRVCVCKFVSRI